MRRAVSFMLLLSACAAGPASNRTDQVAPVPPPPTSTTVAQDALFVANLVEALSSTAFADAVREDPEPFVTTGALMCELLSAGSTPTEVLDQFLQSFGPQPGDADSALAGALLGSAVNVFCPEHRERLIDDLG